jgi:hypothetical protein
VRVRDGPATTSPGSRRRRDLACRPHSGAGRQRPNPWGSVAADRSRRRERGPGSVPSPPRSPGPTTRRNATRCRDATTPEPPRTARSRRLGRLEHRPTPDTRAGSSPVALRVRMNVVPLSSANHNRMESSTRKAAGRVCLRHGLNRCRDTEPLCGEQVAGMWWKRLWRGNPAGADFRTLSPRVPVTGPSESPPDW